MHKRTQIETNNKKYVSVVELQGMLSIGKATANKIGEEANAIVKIGRRKLFNVEKVLNYMEVRENEQTNQQTQES